MMKSKKIKQILACFVYLSLLSVVIGCSNKETKSVDNQFIDDLKAGLMARWDLSASTSANTKEIWDKYISAELSKISDYKNTEFENKNLGDLAKNYIILLEKAQNLTKYVESDNNRFWAEYQPVLDDRCMTLVKINEISNITFIDNEDKKNFDGLLNDGELVIAVRDIMETANFKISEESEYSDYKTYSTTIENKSDLKFSHFNFNINLVDKDGVVVDTVSSSTSNWEPKTKHKFEFGTDAKFKKVEVMTVNYSI